MNTEKFCLRWNDFENNISCAFKELRDDKDFFDVTIACDDEQIQAHKVILSACSPFFKAILRRNPHQHPLLYLSGVSYTDLQSVLNFMYHGEVNVAQEELNSFLAVAENLKVKGLTQQSKSGSKQSRPSYNQAAQSSPLTQTMNTPSPTQTKPPPPPTMPSRKYMNSQSVAEDEVQEVISIKSEPKATTDQPLYSHHQPSNTLATADDQVLDYTEDTYDDYGEYHQNREEHASFQASNQALDSGQTLQDPSELMQYVEQDKSDISRRRYVCTICKNFFHLSKSNVRNHVECKHFPDSFVYNCELCENSFSSKAALQQHKHKTHRPM